MNKVILQLWEESERGWGTRPDGCSLHTDFSNRKQYVESLYEGRSEVAPDVYERVIGDPIPAFVTDNLYNRILKDKSIRLFENELNNLINLEEIIIKHD